MSSKSRERYDQATAETKSSTPTAKQFAAEFRPFKDAVEDSGQDFPEYCSDLAARGLSLNEAKAGICDIGERYNKKLRAQNKVMQLRLFAVAAEELSRTSRISISAAAERLAANFEG
jgi:hypothetical protein